MNDTQQQRAHIYYANRTNEPSEQRRPFSFVSRIERKTEKH